MTGGKKGVIRMKVIQEKVPCKKCDGSGIEMFIPFDVVDCGTCQGKGEVIKSDFVITVSQRAIDDTNKWMKGLKNEQ